MEPPGRQAAECAMGGYWERPWGSEAGEDDRTALAGEELVASVQRAPVCDLQLRI